MARVGKCCLAIARLPALLTPKFSKRPGKILPNSYIDRAFNMPLKLFRAGRADATRQNKEQVRSPACSGTGEVWNLCPSEYH